MPGEQPKNKEADHMKLNLKNLIDANYDLASKFKHSGPMNLIEFSNEFGALFYALDKDLAILEG